MIRLTLEFTDNLGPEADMPALLRKLDARLRAAPIGETHVLAAMRVLTDFIAPGPGGGWASVILALRAPASLEPVASACAADLFDLADAHLAELYLRHSIVVSLQLDLTPGAPLERRHAKSADVSF
jgi:5-carboxymethyl-2-hydroxymuconate isomerase